VFYRFCYMQGIALSRYVNDSYNFVHNVCVQVFRRFNSIGICVSHKQTLRLIRKLGEGYDKVVKEWKKAVESASVDQDLESDDSWVTESSVSDDTENDVFSSTGLLSKFITFR